MNKYLFVLDSDFGKTETYETMANSPTDAINNLYCYIGFGMFSPFVMGVTIEESINLFKQMTSYEILYFAKVGHEDEFVDKLDVIKMDDED